MLFTVLKVMMQRSYGMKTVLICFPSAVGTLPASWKKLTKLTLLYLDQNRFTGNFPSEWGTMLSLYALHVSKNKLSGSLPVGITSSNINKYDISNNSMSGVQKYEKGKTTPNSSGGSDTGRVVGSCLDSATRDREVLVLFYNRNNGSNWKTKTNWNSSQPLNKWYGINTDSAGRVTEIVLRDNKITGSLPVEWKDLTQLIKLDLHGSFYSSDTARITGTLPAAWNSLTKLKILDLSYNKLNGCLPIDWKSWASITKIILSYNELSGNLPMEWKSMSALIEIEIHQNKLTGSLPTSWENIPRLKTLNLAYNSFAGMLLPPYTE